MFNFASYTHQSHIRRPSEPETSLVGGPFSPARDAPVHFPVGLGLQNASQLPAGAEMGPQSSKNGFQDASGNGMEVQEPDIQVFSEEDQLRESSIESTTSNFLKEMVEGPEKRSSESSQTPSPSEPVKEPRIGDTYSSPTEAFGIINSFLRQHDFRLRNYLSDVKDAKRSFTLNCEFTKKDIDILDHCTFVAEVYKPVATESIWKLKLWNNNHSHRPGSTTNALMVKPQVKEERGRSASVAIGNENGVAMKEALGAKIPLVVPLVNPSAPQEVATPTISDLIDVIFRNANTTATPNDSPIKISLTNSETQTDSSPPAPAKSSEASASPTPVAVASVANDRPKSLKRKLNDLEETIKHQKEVQSRSAEASRKRKEELATLRSAKREKEQEVERLEGVTKQLDEMNAREKEEEEKEEEEIRLLKEEIEE